MGREPQQSNKGNTLAAFAGRNGSRKGKASVPGQAPTPRLPDPAFHAAWELVRGHPPLSLIIGGAGTGKTRFVRSLKQLDPETPQVVLAPTGIAALQAEGQTIHSFFQLPPHFLDAEHLDPPRYGRVPRLWRKIGRMVIDEVSMVRADVMDAIDRRLRAARSSDAPFGGVSLVLAGDPMQLPPVIQEEDRELFYRKGYAGGLFTASHALGQLPVRVALLDKTWRQHEQALIDVLGDLRLGRNLEERLAFLNDHCVREPDAEIPPVILVSTVRAADRFNRRGLAALPGGEVTYRGEAEGEFRLNRSLPCHEILELKIDAEVIAVQNGTGWVNGSRGRVVSLGEEQIGVAFYPDMRVCQVPRARWAQYRYVWDEASQRVEAEEVGCYRQMPLIPGWAMTIHRAQGMSLDGVRVDLHDRMFADGHLYVALSRVRGLGGLTLSRPLRPSDVRVDAEMLQFLAWLEIQAGQPALEAGSGEDF